MAVCSGILSAAKEAKGKARYKGWHLATTKPLCRFLPQATIGSNLPKNDRDKNPDPPLGYTLTFDSRTELPRSEFNIPSLEQLARVTGGEINPKAKETAKDQEKTTHASKPLRSILIFLASILFLLEINLRAFFPGLDFSLRG